MSGKKTIINKYIQKIKSLKKHNNLYFNHDKPQISDAGYDMLKQEIRKLENDYKYLNSLGLTKNLVGSAPLKNKFKKKNHLIPMLSLSNAFKDSDMLDFQKH